MQIVFWLWPETYHYHRLRIAACSDSSVRLPLTSQLGADRLKASFWLGFGMGLACFWLGFWLVLACSWLGSGSDDTEIKKVKSRHYTNLGGSCFADCVLALAGNLPLPSPPDRCLFRFLREITIDRTTWGRCCGRLQCSM